MSRMNVAMTKQADVGESFLVFCPRCQELVVTRYSRHLVREELGKLQKGECNGERKLRYLVEHRTDCSKCNVTLFAQFLWQGVPLEGVEKEAKDG